ncbi:MAG: hypothetical protein ACI82I_003365 [Gammaproteobacteria bacterium]|jgi:hypothetical protein
MRTLFALAVALITAPVVRFVMPNTSNTAIGQMDVSLDLHRSTGEFIFDTQSEVPLDL